MHKEGPGNPEHFHTAKKLFKFCSSMLLLRCLLNSLPHNSVTWQHSASVRACEHHYFHQGEAPGPQGLRWLEASPAPDVTAPDPLDLGVPVVSGPFCGSPLLPAVPATHKHEFLSIRSLQLHHLLVRINAAGLHGVRKFVSGVSLVPGEVLRVAVLCYSPQSRVLPAPQLLREE